MFLTMTYMYVNMNFLLSHKWFFMEWKYEEDNIFVDQEIIENVLMPQ